MQYMILIYGDEKAYAGQSEEEVFGPVVVTGRGEVGAGDVATVTILVRPTKKGTITNTAQATAAQPPDPDTTNNSASATTTVKPG